VYGREEVAPQEEARGREPVDVLDSGDAAAVAG
jgi:hypothetical protein